MPTAILNSGGRRALPAVTLSGLFLMMALAHAPARSADSSFVSFEETTPGGQTIAMQPIPAGEFEMGSPLAEPGRQADEGPQHRVRIAPFWMSRCELTWGQFQAFLEPPSHPADLQEIDGTTRPTPIGWHTRILNLGMDEHQPVAGITQYAAKQYCLWLSAQTGRYYRLPTEAEWEYACRAGSTTAFHFGDNPEQLSEYAWYRDATSPNAVAGYQPVGKKRPNAWGLYDMHGNVAEWVLDGYDSRAYRRDSNSELIGAAPWTQPTGLYSRVVRGGSWQDPPAALRSAARRASRPQWKDPDPSFPKSRWYLRSGEFVGFRIVRPLEASSGEARMRTGPDKFQLE